MFDKITARVRHLCAGLDQQFVDPVKVSQKVVLGIYSGVTVSELDTLAAETAAYMSTEHPDYTKLAARISISGNRAASIRSSCDTFTASFSMQSSSMRSLNDW